MNVFAGRILRYGDALEGLVMTGGIANIGDVLASKYRVDKILGVGGMGMVVAATHLELGNKVALKFMLPTALSMEASQRFLREARATSQLTSEHVCRVLDLGRLETGAPYIVMEHLDGHDLHSLMKRRGVLKVSDAVDFVLQACVAMAEAHTKGIIHRDLKPGNLFVCKRADGSALVKVLDFGISKAQDMSSTRTGDIMGSPAYMSPEQMQSTKDVDARADIWSLGVMLYQLVTGMPPFHADSLPAICVRVLNEQPESMQTFRADVPDGFCVAVLRALEKKREDRFFDVGELAAAIAPYGGEHAATLATRISGVLHPPDASSAFSMVRMDVPPTVTTNADTHGMPEADRLAETSAELPSGRSKRPGGLYSPGSVPKLDPRSAKVMEQAERTTFSSGAGESQIQKAWKPSYGIMGAIVAAAGVITLVLVMAMKSGNEPAQASVGTAPVQQATTTPSAPVPVVEPAKIEPIVTPLPDPAPPDPPARTAEDTTPPTPPTPVPVAKSRSHHSTPTKAKTPTPTSKGKAQATPKPEAGSSASPEVTDDDWTHMQHDNRTKSE